MSGFAAALAALPTGTFTGTADGRRYVVTKIAFARNRAIKLVAEERGGSDYISLNWYALTSGGLLRPCEMPEAKVRRFVEHLEVIRDEPKAPAA